MSSTPPFRKRRTRLSHEPRLEPSTARLAPTSSAILTDGDRFANARSFARHLRASNLSPRTIHTYLEGVARFAEFLVGRGMPTDLATIRREHVEAFIEQLLETRKPATAMNRFGALRAFFRWAEEEGEIDASPMAKMRPPTVPQQPPRCSARRSWRPC